MLHLQNILGFTPSNLAIYELALLHRSNATNDNNERLEFLGDAILGAIVGEYLFSKYPSQPEGFLTEMRSKIVNRAILNHIALKLGLKDIVSFNKNDAHLRTSQIFGNALEALIGAIYLDKGYVKTRQFILKRMIKIFVDVDALEGEESNLKNKLIGWGKKNNKELEFVLINQSLEGKKNIFEIGISIDETILCQAKATNKKEASKRAAKLACDLLQL